MVKKKRRNEKNSLRDDAIEQIEDQKKNTRFMI